MVNIGTIPFKPLIKAPGKKGRAFFRSKTFFYNLGFPRGRGLYKSSKGFFNDNFWLRPRGHLQRGSLGKTGATNPSLGDKANFFWRNIRGRPPESKIFSAEKLAKNPPAINSYWGARRRF